MSISEDTTIWKYMDIAKFISLLTERALYFACVSEFQDPFEGVHSPAYISAVRPTLQEVAAKDAQNYRAELASMGIRLSEDQYNWIDGLRKQGMQSNFELASLNFGVSCWHQNEHESEAMWKLYAPSRLLKKSGRHVGFHPRRESIAYLP